MEPLESAARGLACDKQLVDLGKRYPDIVNDLLEIAKAFKGQLGKSTPADTGTAASKIERGEGWCIVAGQSFQVPRGNFDVEFLDDGGVRLHGKSVSYEIGKDGIELVVELTMPNNDNARKLVIPLKKPLTVGKQQVKCLLVTPKPTPKSQKLGVDLVRQPPGGALPTKLEDTPTNVWATLLRSLPRTGDGLAVSYPSLDVFRSSHNKNGLKCYHNVNDGFFFPLREGLVFLQKPLLFLPINDIKEIELERACSASTRNFDLNIVMKQKGVSHEIRMIERDEFQPLSAYIATMEINKPDEAEVNGGKAEGKAKEEEEDSDFESSSEDEGSDSDEDSKSESDRESDVDSSDIDLDEDIEVDEEDTIAKSITRNRRSTRAQIGSSSSFNYVAPPNPPTVSEPIGTVKMETCLEDDEEAQPLLEAIADTVDIKSEPEQGGERSEAEDDGDDTASETGGKDAADAEAENDASSGGNTSTDSESQRDNKRARTE